MCFSGLLARPEVGLGSRFHGSHQTQWVLAVDLANVRGGVAFLEECPRKVGELRDVVESFRRAADAVEIGANANVVHSGNLDRVVDVRDDVGERSTRGSIA